MADFRKVITELGTSPESSLTKQERKSFRNILDYRWRSQTLYGYLNLDLDNLENLFGLIDMESSLAPRSDKLAVANRADLIFTLVKTLELTRKPAPEQLQKEIDESTGSADRNKLRATIRKARHPLGKFVFFAQRLRPHDAIITFNYDTVIEEALLGLSIGPDYGFLDYAWPNVNAKFPVLKLHGSVNFKRASTDSSNGEAVSIVDPELLTNATSAYYDGGSPLLIPPTWNKAALSGPLMEVWQKASARLSAAHRIVFIGYSLPETDLGFRYLLANSLLANQELQDIVVMDPSQDTRRRFASFFADALKSQQRYVEVAQSFPRGIPFLGHPFWGLPGGET